MDEYVQLSSKRAKDRGISIEIIDSQTGEHKKATKEIAAT